MKKLIYLARVDNPSSASKEGRPCLDSSLVKALTQFCDNYRMSTGKCDTVTVEMNGRKETVQKRHHYVTLDELYQLFMEEYSDISINCSKFASFWPNHVLFNSQIPNRISFCRYHIKFIMLLEALCKFHPDIPSYFNLLKALFLLNLQNIARTMCLTSIRCKLFYYTSECQLISFSERKEWKLTTKIISRKLKRVILFNKPCKNWKARYRPLFYHIILSFPITWLQLKLAKVLQFCRSFLQKTIARFFKTRFNLLMRTRVRSQCLQQLFFNVENVYQLRWFLVTFPTRRNQHCFFWTLY